MIEVLRRPVEFTLGPAVAVDDAPDHVDAGPGAGVHGVLQRLHGQAGLHP